jgi:hypothetical protein
MSIKSLYRWTTTGCRGEVCDFTQVGATRCITRDQLADFFARLKGRAQRPGRTAAAPLAGRAEAARQRAIRRAERDYERLDPGAR